jgi:chemotaxis signal transduction protein
MEICLFRIDQQHYAVPMNAVREVLSRPRISPIPLAPPSLSGMTHFRGDIVPVFDLDHVFNKNLKPSAERSRLLVLTQANQILGVQVDQIDELLFPETPEIFFRDSAVLEEPLTVQNRTFRPVSLPRLFHSLQQTLSHVTLQLLN